MTEFLFTSDLFPIKQNLDMSIRLDACVNPSWFPDVVNRVTVLELVEYGTMLVIQTHDSQSRYQVP